MRRHTKSDEYQEEIIHKKRKQAWHRSGAIASCGVVLYEVLPMLDFKIHARSSYFWKDVNCKKCLEFLEIKLVDHVKKHK